MLFGIENPGSQRHSRHKFLTQLFVLDRCPTKDGLISWGLLADPLCMLCLSHRESQSHLFFDCTYNWLIWNHLARKIDFTSPRQWDPLLQSFRLTTGSRAKQKLIRLAWHATIYLLWFEHSRIHRKVFKSVDSITKQASLLIKNQIYSLRDKQPDLTSFMMQIWLANRYQIIHITLSTTLIDFSTFCACGM